MAQKNNRAWCRAECKRKGWKILTVLMAMLVFFAACQKAGEPNAADEYVKGFVADDSKQLSEILTKAYSLQELKSFFGAVPPNERIGFGKNNGEAELTIQDVDEKFPIECLRKNGYTVYQVREGGYFYVFWAKTLTPCSDANAEDAAVYFTAYLSSLKKAGDFDALQEGVSTAEEVAKIDPAFELTFLLSSKTPSYSLLEDGTILEICYASNDRLTSRSDLIVESKKVIAKENCPSKFASVLPIDLP